MSKRNIRIVALVASAIVGMLVFFVWSLYQERAEAAARAECIEGREAVEQYEREQSGETQALEQAEMDSIRQLVARCIERGMLPDGT